MIANEKAYFKMFKGKPGLLLGIFNVGVRMTDDAKSEFANIRRSNMKIADAAVIKSTAGRVAAQFILKFFKSSHKTKI